MPDSYYTECARLESSSSSSVENLFTSFDAAFLISFIRIFLGRAQVKDAAGRTSCVVATIKKSNLATSLTFLVIVCFGCFLGAATVWLASLKSHLWKRWNLTALLLSLVCYIFDLSTLLSFRMSCSNRAKVSSLLMKQNLIRLLASLLLAGE